MKPLRRLFNTIQSSFGTVLAAALLLLVFVQSTDAQVGLGGYVSVSRFKLTGDPPRPYRYVADLSPSLGLSVNIPVKDDVRITFQPGYGFQRSALQWRNKVTDEIRDSIKLRMDVIRLPVMLDIITDNGKWHYLGGIDCQIVAKSKATRGETESDINDEIRLINPMIIFGFGYRIEIRRSVLNIDLRFGQGILNVGTRLDEDGTLVRRTKTSTLELAAVYELPIKHKNAVDD